MDAIDYIVIIFLIVGSVIGLSMVIGDIDDRINHIEDELRRLNDDK